VGVVGVLGFDGTPATGVLDDALPPPPPQADSRTRTAQAGTKKRERMAGRPVRAYDGLMRLIIDVPVPPHATNCNSWIGATTGVF
jgi:hypothetical protein